jgi:hypothetical protein
MKSRLLALSILALGATGCVDDRASLEIYGICGMNEDCTFSDTCDIYHMGTVDFATGGSMLMLAFELHNQLPNNEDLAAGRVNSNDAHVDGGSVEFKVDGTVVSTWGFLTGNSVIPAEGSGLVWTYLAPSTLPAGFVYTAELTLTGYYDNGNDFETGPFPIGVRVFAAGTTFCPATAPDACPGTGDQSVAACVEP